MKANQALVAIAACIATVSACSDETSSGESGGGTGGAAGTAAIGGAAGGGTGGAAGGAGDAATDGGPTVSVSGTVNERTISGDTATDSPLEGVSVCLYQHAEVPCVTSAADGTFALAGVPQNLEGGITATKSGYWSVIATGTTGTTDTPGLKISLLSTSTATALYAALGATYTSGTSASLYSTADTGTTGGVSGVTFAIAPNSGQGPFYVSDQGAPGTTLTATGTWGSAMWTNVTPGDVEATITPPAGVTCSTLLGWTSAKPKTLRTTVIAGYATFTSFVCM